MRAQILEIGTVVDQRFEILGTISSGNFGVVYRVLDRTQGTEAALKVLHRTALNIPNHVARFEREARLGKELDHPNIVPHLTSGRLDEALGGGPYLILALIRGLPLGDLIDARGHLSAAEAVHILGHVLDALDAVHRLGAIHRDLKPDNILLAAAPEHLVPIDAAGSIAGRVGVPEAHTGAWRDLTRCPVTLLDFGLGKFLATEDRDEVMLTAEGMAAGTLYYMSPEQVRARPDVDYRADLYGAAMLLFRMLDGDPPYASNVMLEVADGHLNQAPPALPDDLNLGLLGGVYRKAAAKKRDYRYASAAEMAWALRAANDPVLAAKPPPVFKPPPPLKPMGLWSRLFGR